jgi:fluoride exporter
MDRVLPYLLVGAGSVIGGNARFLVGRWVGATFEGRFPLGTFLINVGGSFVLGFLAAFLLKQGPPNAEALRLAIGIGFCGSFTTFSTFASETNALFDDGAWLVAAANVALSLFTGLMAFRAGVVAARAWF